MTRGLGLVLAALTLSCASSSGAVRAALHDDLANLQKALERERSQGELDRDRVVEVASAVASREVMSGTGPSGVRRIRVMRGCHGPVAGVLQARAERKDDGGAEAALVLLAAGKLDHESAFEDNREASSGAWRAVAARAASEPSRFHARREYFVDADERVRRAAFEAALESPSQLDLDVLLESARLDPDPLSRSLAARAVGAVGGERAVLSLLDRWDRADEDTRLAIVEAWSMPESYVAGGEQQLVKTAESGTHLPALAAANALAQRGGAHAAAATTLLARAIAQGSTDERRLAIRTAPLADSEVRRLLKEAAKDGDGDVRVMALARLLEVPTERAAAQKELQKLAKGETNLAEQARSALSTLGDASVKPELIAALRSKRPGDRLVAALGLLRVGDYAHAASVLADEDATIRATLACSILAREERTH